jgi:hypothetical protein
MLIKTRIPKYLHHRTYKLSGQIRQTLPGKIRYKANKKISPDEGLFL